MTENEKLVRILSATGAASTSDLLLYLPRTYTDYTAVHDRISNIERIPEGDRLVLSAKVRSISCLDAEGGPTDFSNAHRKPVRAKVILFDAYGKETTVMIFGGIWSLRSMRAGSPIVIAGQSGQWEGQFKIASAQIIPEYMAGKVVPVYPALRGIASAAALYDLIHREATDKESLMRAANLLQTSLNLTNDEFKSRAHMSAYALLKLVHSPRSVQEGEILLGWCRGLAVDYVREAATRMNMARKNPESAIRIPPETMRKVLDEVAAHYRITNDQRQAITEIVEDLRQPFAMKRLLSGDVGTGKTLSFLAPAVMANRSGASVVLLVPNQLLVSQASAEITKVFPDVRVQCVGARTRAPLDAGAIIVGTTAILSRAAKEGYEPDMVIVDEQHKFSVKQREQLAGVSSNYLEATATAIPRTMALISHAGMQVSILRESPYQKQIDTHLLIGRAHRQTMFEAMRRAIEEGGQVAVIYPAVSASTEMIHVDHAAQKWERAFPGRVARLHGKMKDAEKISVIEQLRDRKASVLVSSTVIEVGLSLPDLKGIIVVNADRYGLAQLHQLRGRVARHGGKGWCLLYCPKGIESDTEARLELMESTSDGFKLAEDDMNHRGFGSITESEEQSGKTRTLFHNVHLTPADFEAQVPQQRKAGARLAVG